MLKWLQRTKKASLVESPTQSTSNETEGGIAGEKAASGEDRLHRVTLGSLAEYQTFSRTEHRELERRAGLERGLMQDGERFNVEGYCQLCNRPARFEVTYEFGYELDGVFMPNWREHLRCEYCRLNSRMRASLHLLDALIKPKPSASIYITEHHSPIFNRLCDRFSEVVGSEFLRDGTPPGALNAAGFRHENLTRLSFESDRFDAVMSFDVLEHVPDYRAGLRECLRVLRPGGALLFSVPFRTDSEAHLVRARLKEDGTVEHLMEPEYHGDPLDPEGCLAFYQFGWQLVAELRELGFSRSAAHLYWSRHFAYLGGSQLMLTAWK